VDRDARLRGREREAVGEDLVCQLGGPQQELPLRAPAGDEDGAAGDDLSRGGHGTAAGTLRKRWASPRPPRPSGIRRRTGDPAYPGGVGYAGCFLFRRAGGWRADVARSAWRRSSRSRGVSGRAARRARCTGRRCPASSGWREGRPPTRACARRVRTARGRPLRTRPCPRGRAPSRGASRFGSRTRTARRPFARRDAPRSLSRRGPQPAAPAPTRRRRLGRSRPVRRSSHRPRWPSRSRRRAESRTGPPRAPPCR